MSSENNVILVGDIGASTETVSTSLTADVGLSGDCDIKAFDAEVSTTRDLTHYERLKKFCDEAGLEYKEGTTDGSYFHENNDPETHVKTKYIDLSKYVASWGCAVIHFRESDETFFCIEAE